ncbi:mechanosensitive ion channel protein MscL [Lottiidibacillus patelloidae]|uniref:Large-conductance mechanosensitive channel n=1 Tax=Lottiidibacillus patelloidae TaxID=2670334 RepID=A0A263BQB8_9BACI|nr:large conductance mechanosensitive channel protein MscL [Lottiidibacillus patelloidae]OZM55772.1 mechanosensitive ion channel protein MscL [Lottiidibacillus patelloidae]
MRIIKEFRAFIMNGSVAEIGIGMVIGAAFVSVIDSFVSDVLLPPIGLLLAKVNFSELFISLSGGTYETLGAAQEAGAATINYGLFFTKLIRFTLVLFAIFVVIRQINKIRNPSGSPISSMTKKDCPYCFSKIPNLAVKCPLCTSDLEEPVRKKAESKGMQISFKKKSS